MDSTSPVTDEDNANSSRVSHFLKTVVLDDWWLIKADDADVSRMKRLGVAGHASADQAVRAFSSAPIRKSYDVFTLETVDEISVLLKGFINKPRTEENGFPAEVFKHFVFGFPPYWENYVEKFLEGGSGDEDNSKSTGDPAKLVTDSGGPDDFLEGTPKRKVKAVSNSPFTKCDQKDINEATKQITNTKRKRETRSSSRLPNANTCLDDLCENIPNSNRKSITKLRLKSCDNLDSSEAGKGSTGLDLNVKQKLVNSRVRNCDDKDSSQAGNSKNTKKVLRNCSRLSDVIQKDGFHISGCKEKSNVEKEASSSSRRKTKRKLTYGKGPATRGKTNGVSSASPQLSSLKISRSGRKLLPTLEFWRNQTAVYDKGRELTCINFGSLDDPHC